MIELRNRHKGGYEEVSTRDEYDVIPVPRILELQLQPQIIAPPAAKKSLKAPFCFFFSLSGVIFLTTLSLYVGNNSPFLRIPGETDTRRFLHSIAGAAGMYVVCMCVSGYFWYKARHPQYTRSFD